jgi:hypothetical protein
MRERSGPASAVGFIDGVWIEPVVAHLMMNLDRVFPRTA